MKKTTLIVALVLSGLPFGSASAGEEEDMAAMQRALNAEVMARDFDPGDVKRADAYIEEAMKKGIKPEAAAPSFWRPGYTCVDARRYSYAAYRNCRYHYRYYGRYW